MTKWKIFLSKRHDLIYNFDSSSLHVKYFKNVYKNSCNKLYKLDIYILDCHNMNNMKNMSNNRIIKFYEIQFDKVYVHST